MPTDPASSYDRALRRLLSLADYERMTGAAAPVRKQDLARMQELAARVGGPQDCAPVVHIAGTKGKGSVAAMVTSILRASGLRVGTFTSPHLHTFRERTRIDGEPATERQFADALDRVWGHVGAMATESPEGPPTTFEVLTAMAFDLFRREQVDVQVIEVGLGGRLDSTNIVGSAVAAITSISLDHTAVLGDSIQAVAGEKAGIIKAPSPAVVAPLVPEALTVVEARAAQAGAPLVRIGREVTIGPGTHDLTSQEFTVTTAQDTYPLRTTLLGDHQRENAAVAVAAVEALAPRVPRLAAPRSAIIEGIGTVRWDGRFQVLEAGPERCFLVVDGAHNPHSMACLSNTVSEYIAPKRTFLVFGCSGDKELEGMAAEIAPMADGVVVCGSRHPRAVTPSRVAAVFEGLGVQTHAAASVADAMETARGLAGAGDLVLVTGSLFVVAEALQSWYDIPAERYPELDPHQSLSASSTP